jgi:hypothetical protein
LRAQYDNFDAAKRNIDYAQSAIWLSVMDGGDFARYVIGTNSGSFEWSSRRLGVPPTPTRKERYEAFVANLTPRQKKAVERFKRIRNHVALYRRLDQESRKKYLDVAFEDWYKPKAEKYDGPCQGMSLRDIDPSWVLPKTKQTSCWHGFESTWWAPAQVQCDPLLTDTEWIRNSADLPAVEPLVVAIDPRDNSHWPTLKGSYRWEHVNDGDNSDSPYPKRTLRYSVQSYIVKQSDAVEPFKWMKTQWRDTRGFSLRDSNPLDRVFFGEFCWAPAFLYQAVPYYSRYGWVGGKAQDTIPKPILLATDQYAQEDRGFDCSIDGPIRVYLPCQWIAEGMNLRWRGIEGHFYDAAGNLIAFDPSVNSAGPGVLLINRKLFLKYLNENGYTLLWHVTGEKLIIAGNIPGDDWPGRLEILGVFRLQQQKIDGKLYTRVSE